METKELLKKLVNENTVVKFLSLIETKDFVINFCKQNGLNFSDKEISIISKKLFKTYGLENNYGINPEHVNFEIINYLNYRQLIIEDSVFVEDYFKALFHVMDKNYGLSQQKFYELKNWDRIENAILYYFPFEIEH